MLVGVEKKKGNEREGWEVSSVTWDWFFSSVVREREKERGKEGTRIRSLTLHTSLDHIKRERSLLGTNQNENENENENEGSALGAFRFVSFRLRSSFLQKKESSSHLLLTVQETTPAQAPATATAPQPLPPLLAISSSVSSRISSPSQTRRPGSRKRSITSYLKQSRSQMTNNPR